MGLLAQATPLTALSVYFCSNLPGTLEYQKTVSTALERLYRDEGTRLKMGEAARERVKVAYHWDTLGERLMEFYRPSVTS